MGKLNGGISGTTLNRERWRWRLGLSLLLFAWLAVGASPPARAGLTASPSACYVDGSGLCATQITWQSNNMSTVAEIFVSMDGRPGVPFACNAGNFQATAPWIQAGHYYAFVAYPTRDCAAMSTDGLGAPFAGVAVMGYSVTGQLSASPNPCYVGSNGLCTAVITWQSAQNAGVEIFVSMDGGPPKLFACNAGSFQSAASWIQAGHSYAFIAYRSNTCTATSPAGLGAPLSSVAIMGHAVTGQLSASPNPCYVGSNGLCTAVITWQSAQNAGVEIFVSMDGGPPKLFACNAGSFQSAASWIQAGHSYNFVAYRSSTCTATSPAGLGAPLSGVAVTGNDKASPRAPAQTPISATAAYEKSNNLLLVGTALSPGVSSMTGPIYSLRADGTDRTLLTNDGAMASWTPDGSILFVSLRSGSLQIWKMAADGSNAKQIGNLSATMVPMMPQMGKNGLIVFMANDTSGISDGNTGIWTMHGDGSGLRELVRGQQPFLAPSGTWVAYTLETNTPDGSGNTFNRQVWRINMDGTGKQQLTFLGDTEYPDANAPAISPDEKTIALFSGKEDSGDPDILHVGRRSVAIIPATGGARITLTSCVPPITQADLQSDTVASGHCFEADNPSWTPDGQWLIFDTAFIDGLQTWMIDLNGQNFQQFYPGLRGTERVPLKPSTK